MTSPLIAEPAFVRGVFVPVTKPVENPTDFLNLDECPLTFQSPSPPQECTSLRAAQSMVSGTLSQSLSSLMATAGISFKNIATLEACFLANMKIGMLLWRATKVQDHNAIEFVHVAMKGLLLVPLDARGGKGCICGAT